MEKITNKTLYSLKNVSQPVTNSEYVFFIETKMNKKENNYTNEIYRMNIKTKERTRFSGENKKHTKLDLTPNKNFLTYLSNDTQDEQMQLFIMPILGGSPIQLTTEENGVNDYYWLKDSQTVYYQTTVDKERSNKKEELPTKSEFTRLQYKADGSGSISENINYQIKKIEIKNEDENFEAKLILEKNRAISLSFVSKTEDYLLYYDQIDPEDEWFYGGTVYKYDLKTENSVQLTKDMPNGIFDVSLSSEHEDYFLLTGNNFAYKFVTNNAIYGYNIKTKKLQNLTKTLDFGVGDSLVGDFQQNLSGEHVWWLKDGESFLFLATEHGKTTLYIGNIDGALTKIYDQKMHITGLTLIEGKQQALITYSTLTNPSALAKLDLQSGKLVDLYLPNEKILKNYKISKPESFWFKSVKDWKIQGWYVPPIDQSKSHPAILYIHGGPQVSYGETFFHEMQALAASGYGIIMLNPRGGSGYGQEFVASILNNYGDEDYQDLLNGTDYVLGKYPSIDPDNIFVAGGSYGGFMTNWIVGHTNRFKAAVTQRSISNWISFYGTSDIGPAFVEFQLGRDLSKVEELWKLSPLAYAHQAQTPLLVIHGEEDLRCPIEQGEQMYIAMKKQNIKTKFVTFPKSSHGLSREGLPNLRIERLDEILNWFEQFRDK